ncbi:MAG: SMC-Scp complex subunit ScpB [bacterium]|nr:SMC-Scp complex subunit ScpB [bacterium]
MIEEYQTDTVEKIEQLAARAEAFLFAEGEPMAIGRLKKLLSCTDEELEGALQSLSNRREGSGMTLIRTTKEAALAVSPSCAPAIRAEIEKDLEREIGDAGLEVLAILLYRGPSTRSQIDYIRGVNTSTTLRTLLARGLTMRTENPNDSREYLYHPTAELLAHLGASDITKLPDYEKIIEELKAFEESKEKTL